MSINRVIISGNLTRDPELRSTASGLPVLGFGVAVNDRRKNQQTGEWEDYPNFIDCTMFGARAEHRAVDEVRIILPLARLLVLAAVVDRHAEAQHGKPARGGAKLGIASKVSADDNSVDAHVCLPLLMPDAGWCPGPRSSPSRGPCA